MFVKGAALFCSLTFTIGICSLQAGTLPPPSLSPSPKGDCLKRDKAGSVAGVRMNWKSPARLKAMDNRTGQVWRPSTKTVRKGEA